MKKNYQVCTRCVFDTTVKNISFDDQGECIYCKIYDLMKVNYPLGQEGTDILHKKVTKIKQSMKGRKYDCVVGVSGGTDSTFLLAKVVELGLKPVAVHYDNGWNSEIAAKNIRNILEKLNVPLFTVVEDWNEMKDIQKSFLYASTCDGDTPTDIGLKRALYKGAVKYNVRTIVTGYTFRNEGVCPIDWTYMEGKYIEDVHRKFGTVKMKKFNNVKIAHALYYIFIKNIHMFHPLNYMSYYKNEAKQMLSEKYGWVDYGGHHHENLYTKFYQSFLLPQKFKIDKRRRELSASILSGKITRDQALSQLKKPYECDNETVAYTLKKLGINDKEFKTIMQTPPKSFRDYNTYFTFIHKYKWIIEQLCKREILPRAFYYKYIYSLQPQNQ